MDLRVELWTRAMTAAQNSSLPRGIHSVPREETDASLLSCFQGLADSESARGVGPMCERVKLLLSGKERERYGKKDQPLSLLGVPPAFPVGKAAGA